MSSGTQIELDWTGIDAEPSGGAAPPASGANGVAAGAGAYLTDEEILGIEPVGAGTTTRDVIPNEGRNPSVSSAGAGEKQQRDSSSPLQAGAPRNDATSPNAASTAYADQRSAAMPEWMQAVAGDPRHAAEAQQLWREHQAFRASFASPEEARAIKELFPGGAQEVQMLKQASQSVDRIDAAIFSGDARAQSEVVAELARANPAAFRSLFAEAAKVLAGMGGTFQNVPQAGPTLRETREGWGTQQISGTGHPPSPEDGFGGQGPATNHPSQELRASESRVTNQASPAAEHQSPVTSHQSPTFDAAAYAAFERSTNDAVARDVRAAVGDTLARVLPEGIAEGAARRIGEDIFNEIHRTLAADRSLSEQVGEVLRGSPREFVVSGWRFGTAEQQRVASLLAVRAKQLVPGVARRVIGEWTSSVLGASRSKAARQTAAAARVDIATPGGSLDSMPLRAMSGRQIDYASMSDDEILGM